ncbi:MAG: ABC transporter substrate-binding protein [Dehalococcoidia bacterium]
MRVGISADAKSLGWSAIAGSTGFQDAVMRVPCLETLARYDAAGNPTPWLATGWQGDSKALTFTVTLRKGVKFHDGTDFNATAAKWNLDQEILAKRAELSAVKSIDVVDDYTIRLNLSQWDNSIVYALASYTTGVMISPTNYQNGGSTDADRKNWALFHPVGTGPFKFVNWQQSVKVVYTKFDGYWQPGKPYLSGIEFDVIADVLVEEASFLKGDLDVIYLADAQTSADLTSKGKYVVNNLQTGINAATRGIVGNSADPNSPFANVKVRQAVYYAIDKQAINKAIFLNLGVVTDQWAAPGTWTYNPQVSYPYDVAKAKSLLADAGYANGIDCNLYFPNRPPLPDLYAAVQSYLKAVGIRATLQPVTDAKFLDQGTKGWDGLIEWAVSLEPDPLKGMMDRLLSTGVGAFAVGITHPKEIDNLMQQASLAPDLATKQALMQQLQKLVTLDYALADNIVITPDISVIQPYVNKSGFSEVTRYQWTPEDIFIKK